MKEKGNKCPTTDVTMEAMSTSAGSVGLCGGQGDFSAWPLPHLFHSFFQRKDVGPNSDPRAGGLLLSIVLSILA